MRVQPNPARAVDGRLTVVHPRTGKPFPAEPSTLSPADVRDPLIRRLLPPATEPGGLPGGVFGDLVVVPDAAPAKITKPRKTEE